MIGHRMKAFRLTPERLDDRVDLGRKLPHFADESLEGSCRGRTEDPDEAPRNAWSAARQESEASTDNADMRQERTDPR
jgi:hypothetical protein